MGEMSVWVNFVSGGLAGAVFSQGAAWGLRLRERGKERERLSSAIQSEVRWNIGKLASFQADLQAVYRDERAGSGGLFPSLQSLRAPVTSSHFWETDRSFLISTFSDNQLELLTLHYGRVNQVGIAWRGLRDFVDWVLETPGSMSTGRSLALGRSRVYSLLEMAAAVTLQGVPGRKR